MSNLYRDGAYNYERTIRRPATFRSTVSGAIYFLGKYRPACFEADSVGMVAAMLRDAAYHIPDNSLRDWLWLRIEEGTGAMLAESCSAWSADHCDRGVAFAKRPHDPFLDRLTATMPACPGLDYSGAVNVRHGPQPGPASAYFNECGQWPEQGGDHA